MTQKKYLDNNGLLYFWQKIVNAFVKKDGNKVLTDNNYTTEEKNKLAGLQNYILPKATTTTLGGIKAGEGVEITADGTLNATGGGTADSVDWSNVQNKPTTIAGYGITDAKIENKKITIGTNSVTVPSNNNELENGAGYQTSQQVQSAINTAVGKITQFGFQIVSELPRTGKKGIIYLIPKTKAEQNIYDEYIWIDTGYELIGTTAVDLTGYLKENDLVAITNEEIDGIVAG